MSMRAISSTYKKIIQISLFTFSFMFVACDTIKTRSEISKTNTKTHEPAIPPALRPEQVKTEIISVTPVAPPTEISQATVSNTTGVGGPQIGIIFGPGGIRSFAHIGVIRELVRSKIPIHSVVGMEFGALTGGIFASKAQMYDVEWQMMKLHEEDLMKKALMGSSKPQDVSVLSEFLQRAMPNSRIEDMKIPFACPTYNLIKKQHTMISRGMMSGSLPLCIPYFPFYNPYGQNIAGLTSLSASANYLRSKGMTYLIYVDLLNEDSGSFFSDINSSENLAWSVVAESNEIQRADFNKVIKPQLSGFYITDFAHRRDMIQKGQEAARAVITEIQKDLGI